MNFACHEWTFMITCATISLTYLRKYGASCPKQGFAAMASSSMEKICHFCRKWSTNLHDGWRLRDGCFALLCNKCIIAFENDRFCQSFHKQESGWRDCIECGKSIHCGCVVDRHTYVINDVKGITCIGCLVDHFPEEPQNPSEPSNVVDQSFKNSDDIPGSQESGKTGENSIEKSYQGDYIIPESSREEVTGLATNLLISHSVPKEIVEVATYQMSALVPLFEIVLSRGDVNPKIGRLVIPETYAQEYFPIFPERQGTPMRIWDSECRLWKFMLRPMMIKKKQMTVLDGTRKCIRTMQWKSGDILKFYRKDPEGEMFIGLKKIAAAGSSVDQSQNLSSSRVS